jgi:hypothetical protein
MLCPRLHLVVFEVDFITAVWVLERECANLSLNAESAGDFELHHPLPHASSLV